MLYISGEQALNLPCQLETCGDWHYYSMNWSRLDFRESEESIYKDYGLEYNRVICGYKERYVVANHIRAILDMLYEHKFDLIWNFKEDYICNDKYTEEILLKVSMMLPDDKVYDFMHREYGRQWLQWIGQRNISK